MPFASYRRPASLILDVSTVSAEELVRLVANVREDAKVEGRGVVEFTGCNELPKDDLRRWLALCLGYNVLASEGFAVTVDCVL